MSKASLLELAKKIKHTSSKLSENKELEEAIKDIITVYKEIIFTLDTPPAWRT